MQVGGWRRTTLLAIPQSAHTQSSPARSTTGSAVVPVLPRTARREASPFAECDHANARGAPMAHELQHDRVSERKGMLSMTRSKRQYGSGCLLTRGRGWAIRWRVTEITRQEVQAYVAHLVNNGYAPRTTDHIHDVLSAVLRTAVKWGHLQENPARAVDLGALINVRPKWALTIAACNRTTSS